MKKLFASFFILLSLGTLSAQNLNFKDTNGLKTLLCSHTWIRYQINPDSTFSDKVMDSIKFYANGTYYQSARPKVDTIENDKYILALVTKGKWMIGLSGKTSRKDTATDCINIVIGINSTPFVLIDGHRINGSKRGKIHINLDGPFIIWKDGQTGALLWDNHIIWQPKRQFKKTKKIGEPATKAPKHQKNTH